MQRAKIKNKKKSECTASTHFIMNVIMPCIMLACKDEFKIKDQERLTKLNKRVNRYIEMISDGTISEEELHQFMIAVDSKHAMLYLESVTEGKE